MTLSLICETSVLTVTVILFHINTASAYEFKADNMTYLKLVIKEAMQTDAYEKRLKERMNYTNSKKHKTVQSVTVRHKTTYKTARPKLVNLILSKDKIDEELHKKEEVLTEALRMGPPHSEDETDGKKVLSIQLEDLSRIKYPVIVKVINLDDSIRRSENNSHIRKIAHFTHEDPSPYKSKAEQRYEELKERRHKLQERQMDMSLFFKKHELRMKAVIAHIEEHFMSSLYLYQEMLRIKRTGRIRDRAREMLKYMDDAGNTAKGKMIRDFFYTCYKEVRPTDKIEVWNSLPNNNLLIHYVMDNPNDGVN